MIEGGGAGGLDRRRPGEVGALGDEPLVGPGGAGVEEHPFVLGDTQCLGGGHARDDHAGGQVHLEVRAHQLGVRRGHGAVRGVGVADIGGGARGGIPRVRVLGGDRAVAGPQVGDLTLVGVGGLAGIGLEGGFDERVDVDRRAQSDAGLGLVVGRAVDTDDTVRAELRILPGPVRLATQCLDRRDRGAGLGAADQCEVGGPVRDLLRRVVHGELCAVAAVGGGLHGLGELGADGLGEEPGLVGVCPGGARDGVDEVRSGQEGAFRAGVRGGGL